MSETTEQPASEAAPEPPVIETEAPQAEAAPENAEQQPEPPAEPAEETPQPAAKQKDRRFAHLTARIQAEAQAREVAEKRAEAAEALLRVNRQGDDETPPPRPPQTVDVRAEARRMIEEERFNTRLAEIDATGKKDLGGEAWEEAKATMTSLGAVNNPAFLRALAEAENPARIFSQLAEDTDALVGLLQLPETTMVARVMRMDAKISQPVLAAKPTSNAPRPPAPVHTSSAPVQPSLEQLAKGSVDDYVAQLKKEFPNSKLFAGIR